MDAEYDVNMLSTSLNECILRGLLSIDDLKVLHMDRNEYYGEESTSLNLNKLWTRFRGNDKLLPYLGASRDYSMDMNPRFSLVNGNLVHVLIHTNISLARQHYHSYNKLGCVPLFCYLQFYLFSVMGHECQASSVV